MLWDIIIIIILKYYFEVLFWKFTKRASRIIIGSSLLVSLNNNLLKFPESQRHVCVFYIFRFIVITIAIVVITAIICVALVVYFIPKCRGNAGPYEIKSRGYEEESSFKIGQCKYSVQDLMESKWEISRHGVSYLTSLHVAFSNFQLHYIVSWLMSSSNNCIQWPCIQIHLSMACIIRK